MQLLEPSDLSSPFVPTVHTEISEFPVRESSQLQFYEIRANKEFSEAIWTNLIPRTYLSRVYFKSTDLRRHPKCFCVS